MSKLKYEVGQKLMVAFSVVEADDEDDESTYKIQSKLTHAGTTDELIKTWISERTLDIVMEEQNPSLKRKRIEAEIAALQEQLKQI